MLAFLWKRRRKVYLSDDLVQHRRQRVTVQPDARMSKNARVRCVTAIVDDQPDWDYALDTEKSLQTIMTAAAHYGYQDPLTKEQKILRDFLLKNIAGRKISMYAWGVYADICGDLQNDVLLLE